METSDPLMRVHTEGGAAMPKCEKVTAGQAQAKEDMINMILKMYLLFQRII